MDLFTEYFRLTSPDLVLLDVGSCKEVEFNDNAVNNLVMKDDRKTVIRSLVHRYTIADTKTANVLRGGRSQNTLSQPWTADFIKNKGDGQIFLLHGGPGVGKTYVSTTLFTSDDIMQVYVHTNFLLRLQNALPRQLVGHCYH